MWHRGRTALLALLLCSSVQGANYSTLDRWLEHSAAPELADTLSKHPRFSGEVVRMSAMHNSHLVAASNALVQAIERDLTLHLNRFERVRIRWPGTEPAPSDPPAHYVLGIEVRPEGDYQHSVTLVVIDLAEKIWVSGTATRWEGRLTREQKRMLTAVSAPPAEPPVMPTASNATVAIEPITYRSVRRSGVCNRHHTECVEADVTLPQPAALLVFSSSQGTLQVGCQAPEHRAAGTYRFRLPVHGRGRGRGDLGIYALAAPQAVAADLHAVLSNAAGNCSGNANPAWQHDLQQALDTHEGRYAWQALHLHHANGSLKPLQTPH